MSEEEFNELADGSWKYRIDELVQQRDEYKKDAERYRWLRANWTLLRSMATRTTLKFGFEANAWADFGEPVIDAAIDAAMKEQK